jgi:sugar phosphate isomerase/epimerase
MKISVASYAFHGLLYAGKMDIFGYLESCRYRYHLSAADIWNGFFPSIEPDFLAKVKEGMDERELELANLCVDGPHIWEDDPNVREEHYQNALAYLDAARTLGARTLRIDAGGMGETYTSEQFDLIVRRYREYAQIAHDHGFRVGPENHWGAEAVPENMKRICEAVDHPGFGVLLHFRGTPGDALMAPWAMHTHISWDITEKSLPESLNMLRATGYAGYYGIEHHTGTNEYSEVDIQVAKVRDLGSRWAALHTTHSGPEDNPMIPEMK